MVGDEVAVTVNDLVIGSRTPYMQLCGYLSCAGKYMCHSTQSCHNSALLYIPESATERVSFSFRSPCDKVWRWVHLR